MRRILSCCVVLACLTSLTAGDWPVWRGPTGQGHCQEKNLPLNWDGKTNKNVLWKAPLPGTGKLRVDHNQSSPVVVAGKVFVTVSVWPAGTTAKEIPEHHVLCFDAASGKALWGRTVQPGPWSRASDLRGGYTVPTPAADDKRVVVIFGSSVIAALDHSGKQLWRKEILPAEFDVAMASSPVLYRTTAIVQLDGVKRSSRMIAYDLQSGEEKWKQDRAKLGFSHSTPVLASIAGRPQLLVAAANAVQGVDPGNGKLLWWCQASGDTASPVTDGRLVYCDGGRGGPGVCVDPDGKGDITRTNRRWKLDHVPEGYSSPIIVGDRLYRLTNPGVLHSYSLASGKPGESIRLNGVLTAVSPVSTPGGRIYLASAGKSYVVASGSKLKILATNDLGDPCPASPAVADGKIYLKGARYLWCIGVKE